MTVKTVVETVNEKTRTSEVRIRALSVRQGVNGEWIIALESVSISPSAEAILRDLFPNTYLQVQGLLDRELLLSAIVDR